MHDEEMAAAGSTTSSLTSTSHTLTFAPAMPPASASSGGDQSSAAAFLRQLDAANRYQFLRPSPSTPAASLQIVKDALDAFAGQVSDEQQQRLREANKKRKRGSEPVEVLKIRKLHVDGLETDQVWQQAKRIISSALLESRAALQELEDGGMLEAAEDEADIKTVTFGRDGFEVASDGEEDSFEGCADGVESSDQEAAVSGSELGDDGTDLEDDEDGEDEDEDEENDGEVGGGSEGEDEDEEGEYVQDVNGLNDGFFSIDEFNKQTQWFEDQDARADPTTDAAASDDEEVDWHEDPMAAPASKPKSAGSKSKAKAELEEDPDDEVDPDFAMGDDDDDDDDDHGPTFGDMDLDAPEGASDEELANNLEGGLGDGLDLTANDVFYKDFFAPPPKKGKKSEKGHGERRPNAPPRAYDVNTAIADVKRDLFEDLSEASGSEEALSEADAGDPKSRRSAHERRQAKILTEIRKLEAEMVKPKEWTMSGEAAAPERPLNSLLEADLDFEHAGKAAPIITEEVSESIEAMIKRRIIAREFDEVIRRLPVSGVPADTRRGLVEVDDTKAKQGLAELYEEDFVKNSNPDTYVSKSDEKLQKEEKEVEQMWKDICGKLDALSSWHYKPKPAAPSLSVVADVATISMEDAQPTTAAGVNAGGMLAPQEVYKAGKDTAAKGEIVTAKSGLPIARQEMSREDKLRRRRREKERIRKGGGAGRNSGAAPATQGTGAGKSKGSRKEAQENKETLAELKKGGVMVINRQGDIMDVNGNKPKATRHVTSGSFKL